MGVVGIVFVTGIFVGVFVVMNSTALKKAYIKTCLGFADMFVSAALFKEGVDDFFMVVDYSWFDVGVSLNSGV